MIENEFVPYEQALALKELGFDEPCFATYNTDKKVSRNPSHNMEDLPIEGQPYYWQNSKIHITCITAPTVSQAFRWFREKYSLNHFIDSTRNEGNYKYSIYKREKSESVFPYKWNVQCYSNIDCTEYEEAELECLLKLIEIVKTK